MGLCRSHRALPLQWVKHLSSALRVRRLPGADVCYDLERYRVDWRASEVAKKSPPNRIVLVIIIESQMPSYQLRGRDRMVGPRRDERPDFGNFGTRIDVFDTSWDDFADNDDHWSAPLLPPILEWSIRW